MNLNDALPIIFFGLMGLALFAYVVLDGYDLGVGMLLPFATDNEKDLMVSSIGPFWDANETWIVLGIGVLLIAFPNAYGLVLTSLYLPVTLMLVGLIMRGVAFDFRIKAHSSNKPLWNSVFVFGSILAAMSQGWMLGSYITGFESDWKYMIFSAIISILLPLAYVLIGASWLIMKTENNLQQKAVKWAKYSLFPVMLGISLISIITPAVNDLIYQKWFEMPNFLILSPIPLITLISFVLIWYSINTNKIYQNWCWVPFAATIIIFLLSAIGLAYSLFPYIVINKFTIWQTISSAESLIIVLIGCLITVPAIIGYTIFTYYVFRGKTCKLNYG